MAKNETDSTEMEGSNGNNEKQQITKTADGLLKIGDSYFDPKTLSFVDPHLAENPEAKRIHKARTALRNSQLEDPLFIKQENLRENVNGEGKMPIEKVGKTGNSSTGEGPTQEQKDLVKANIDEVLKPYYQKKYGKNSDR